MVPTFISIDISTDSTKAGAVSRLRSKSRSPVARIDPVEQKLAVWGEPKLYVRDISAGQFGFQLRSRVNTPILGGGPLAIGGDVLAAANALLASCSQEDLLQVDRTPDGFIVTLVDAQGAVLGATDLIETEALVRAMIRLIVVQAQSAVVVLPAIGSSSHLRMTR